MATLEIWKLRKKALKLTNQDIANLSNLPLRTVEQVMCGKVKNPRNDTVLSIERALGLATGWKEEEKSLGVGKTAVVLSDKDEYRLTLLARADEVLGEDYTKAYLYALEIAIQQNLSK